MVTSKMLLRQEYVDNLIARAWYKIRPGITDQVLKITPLYDMMLQNKRIKTRIPDGRHWEDTIRYSKQDQNIKWFGKGDVFSTNDKEELTNLLWRAKNLGAGIVRYWEEESVIKGEAKLHEYAEDKVNSTKEALRDTLASAIWSNPTGNTKQITALTDLISTDPTTGYIGTLDRASNPHLRNYIYNFSGKTVSTQLLEVMTKVYNTVSQFRTGSQRNPDIILTTQDIYEQYEAICEALRQIHSNGSDRASLGMGELMFKNTEMFWDPECPAGNMYFLNTETLEMPVDPALWMEMTDWKVLQGTSLDRTAQIVSRMQLCCKMPAKNAVIYNIPASGL
jgi:hypothetical protein